MWSFWAHGPEAKAVARSLSADLGRKIAPEHLRALVTAAADWEAAEYWAHDIDIQGEGIRALDGGEREEACRFLDDADLMARIGLMTRTPDHPLMELTLSLCPVNGMAEALMHVQDLCGGTTEDVELAAREAGIDLDAEAERVYHSEAGHAMRRAARMMRYRGRRTSRSACRNERAPRRVGARARGAGRPRASASSRTSSQDPGESDPADGSGPPQLRLRRTQYGLVSPNLLGILLHAEVSS